MSGVWCIYSGRDGQSHFSDQALRLKPDAMGRLSTGFIAATAWMYGVCNEDRFVDWHTAGPGGVSLVLEGRMEIEVGSGDRRTFLPGDLLVALDTSGQGHRLRMPARSRGLTIALDGAPRELMMTLFGCVLEE